MNGVGRREENAEGRGVGGEMLGEGLIQTPPPTPVPYFPRFCRARAALV